jgi:uncharacterized lipoprotein YehR (DUF1307 family)
MVFYGNGIVWDAVKNKNLCRVSDGKYETDNDEIIQYLIKLGFNYESEIIVEDIELKEPDSIEKIDIDYKELNFTDLKKKAKEKGINSYKMSKEELIASLEKVGD